MNWEITAERKYGHELNRRRYQSTLLVDLDLTEARNTGSVFNECTSRRARFNGSAHQGAAFANCTFAACNFFDSTFTECKFRGCFDGMQVVDGDWSFVGLPGADLRKATFRGTRLREADLTGARWTASFRLSLCDHLMKNPLRRKPRRVSFGGRASGPRRRPPGSRLVPFRLRSAAVFEGRLGVCALCGRRGEVRLGLGRASGEAEGDEAQDDQAAGAFHVRGPRWLRHAVASSCRL